MGLETRGLGDLRTRGRRDVGLGDIGTWDSGMWDTRTSGLRDAQGLKDVGHRDLRM